MISCKKATYLISKKEEQKISFVEKLQLKLHLLACIFCRLFEQQSKVIGANAGHAHQHHHATLSDASKEKMIRLLEEFSD